MQEHSYFIPMFLRNERLAGTVLSGGLGYPYGIWPRISQHKNQIRVVYVGEFKCKNAKAKVSKVPIIT